MLEFKNYPMKDYRYVSTFDESDLEKLEMSQEEIEKMFGSYDYDKFIGIIKKNGWVRSEPVDLNSCGRECVIEHGNYLIGVFTSVMGSEEWHLFEKI